MGALSNAPPHPGSCSGDSSAGDPGLVTQAGSKVTALDVASLLLFFKSEGKV